MPSAPGIRRSVSRTSIGASGQLRDRLVGVVRLRHGEPLVGEIAADRGAKRDVVVDDQDGGHPEVSTALTAGSTTAMTQPEALRSSAR